MASTDRHNGNSQHRAKDEEVPDREGSYGDQAPHAPIDPPSRTYFVKIPVRAVIGQVEEKHLHRLSLFLSVCGALFLAVGVIAILFPLIFSLAVGQFTAWLLVLGGVVSFVQFFVMCGAPGTSSFLLLGALHLGFGLWIIIKPISDDLLFVYVMCGWFVGHGLLKLLTAFQVRKLTSWPAVLASGVLSFFLALLILLLSPRYGVFIIGIVFGVDLLVSGISMMLISCMAFFGKRAEEPQREHLLRGNNDAVDASV